MQSSLCPLVTPATWRRRWDTSVVTTLLQKVGTSPVFGAEGLLRVQARAVPREASASPRPPATTTDLTLTNSLMP